MNEHLIPVAFDVTAPDEQTAVRIVAETIGRGGLLARIQEDSQRDDGSTIEAWWFPQVEHKHVDGNDNSAMSLVDDRDLEPLTPTLLARLSILQEAGARSYTARWMLSPDETGVRRGVVRGFRTAEGNYGHGTDVRDLHLHISGIREWFLPVRDVLTLMEAALFHVDNPTRP